MFSPQRSHIDHKTTRHDFIRDPKYVLVSLRFTPKDYIAMISNVCLLLLFPLSFPYSPASVAASRPRAIHVRERMARTGLRARGRSGGLSFAALPS